MSIKKIVTKKGKVRWQVDLREDGRGSKRLRKVFDKKIDAQKWESDYKQSDENEKKFFEETSFRKEALFWLESSKVNFSAGHLKRVEGILREILPSLGRLDPMSLNVDLLSRFQKELKEKKIVLKSGEEKIPSNITVNRKTEVIKAILNFAVKRGRIPFDPSVGFHKLPSDSEEMLFWEDHEARSFLECADERYPLGSDYRWVYVAYLLALNTGLRAGEIWGLKPIDIVNDGESLFIRRQFNRVTQDFGPLKSKNKSKAQVKSRHVPCNSELLEELRMLIERGQIGGNHTIFQNYLGRPVDHDSFADRFLRDQKRWGGRIIRFHDLRHTATTLFISAGIDLMTVKEICGHESVKTTMNYVHLVGNSIRRVGRIHSISVKNDRSSLQIVS